MNMFFDIKLSTVIDKLIPGTVFCIAAMLFYKNGWDPADFKALAAIIFGQSIIPTIRALVPK